MRLALLLLLAGCAGSGNGSDAGVQLPADGGAVFSTCTALCYRPGDCEVAYPDDDVCPPGFLCSLHFTCVADGGRD